MKYSNNRNYEFIKYFRFTEKRKSYLHGDFYSRHIIINPSDFSLSGLIDWGDVHVGSSGIDLASGMIFTEENFKIFLNTYENIDQEILRVLLFHSFCHSISFLPYAYEQNNEALKKWAALVLKRVVSELNH